MMLCSVTPTFEAASAADLDLIRATLSASDLPFDDIDEHVGEFILARCEGATIGTVAVQYTGQAALLRSLCVVRDHRGRAIGTQLLAAIETKVARRGVLELYLLTTSAGAFFERLGFSMTSRSDAPPGIRSTAQFLTLCPSTAVCMRKNLSAIPNQPSGAP